MVTLTSRISRVKQAHCIGSVGVVAARGGSYSGARNSSFPRYTYMNPHQRNIFKYMNQQMDETAKVQ
jgi:hypothetical protein